MEHAAAHDHSNLLNISLRQTLTSRQREKADEVYPNAVDLLDALCDASPTTGVSAALRQENAVEQLKEFGQLVHYGCILTTPDAWWRLLAGYMPWGQPLTSSMKSTLWQERSVFHVLSTLTGMPVNMQHEFLLRSTHDADHFEIMGRVFSREALVGKTIVRVLPPDLLNIVRQQDASPKLWKDGLRRHQDTWEKEIECERICLSTPTTHIREVVREILCPDRARGFAWLQNEEIHPLLEQERRFTSTNCRESTEYPNGYAHHFVLWALEWHPEMMAAHHADTITGLLKHRAKEIRLAGIRGIGQRRREGSDSLTQ